MTKRNLKSITATIVSFSAIIIYGCSSPKADRFSYYHSEEPWIDAFKDKAFIACLNESYKNDSIFKLIEKEDAFNPYDGLSLEALKLANRIGENVAKNIPPPAMCEGCTEGQNYYMATCLHYYKSYVLDSIARAEYKKYVNSKR